MFADLWSLLTGLLFIGCLCIGLIVVVWLLLSFINWIFIKIFG